MRELSLHILDLVDNSIGAKASRIQVSVREDLRNNVLEIGIEDNGKGMSKEMVQSVIDPFVTTRTTRKVGLGIPLFKEAAETCNGSFTIDSELGVGTVVKARFQHDHLDRMPLGDMVGTFTSLIIGTPEINFVIKYDYDDYSFVFDDKLMKQELADVPLSDPAVIEFVKESLKEGFSPAIHQSES
ncbi:MAG TPA: ATP-binding protein [Bellilinea sp.]|nr:ATP-binding protein [Bellilinea sp.]